MSSTESGSPALEATQSFTVDAAHAGKRLDRFLVDVVEGLSRARARAMLDGGSVRVDGRRPRKGDPLVEGARVDLLDAPPPRDFEPRPDTTVALRVLFEDPDVAVVDKPAGIAAHPLRADEVGTLANAIIARWPETASVGFARREPGLLHRLDTETSGVVVVARSLAAFDALRAASTQDRVTKSYVALVDGRVEAAGRVEYPLVPHRKDPKRVEAVTPHVRLRAGTKMHDAKTEYRPVRTFVRPAEGPEGVAAEFSLVEVTLTRAFRHQIRVHMAVIGHPLVGDALYRGSDGARVGLARHFLHATAVSFAHPITGRDLRVESPLPDDLQHALDVLSRTP